MITYWSRYVLLMCIVSFQYVVYVYVVTWVVAHAQCSVCLVLLKLLIGAVVVRVGIVVHDP